MNFCSKFGNCNFNWWWVVACTSSKCGNFWLWSSIWPWRSQSIIPQNNRALNQGLLHLWFKFGDPSLNGWWVIARTNSWLTDTRTHTHIHTHAHRHTHTHTYPRAGNDNTRRPKLASGKNAPGVPSCVWTKTAWKVYIGTDLHTRSTGLRCFLQSEQIRWRFWKTIWPLGAATGIFWEN